MYIYDRKSKRLQQFYRLFLYLNFKEVKKLDRKFIDTKKIMIGIQNFGGTLKI